MQKQYNNSRRAYSHYLGLAKNGYKQSCRAAKFWTFYVWNLSFKANPTDIQKAFEKQLLMKVDSVVIARDSTGKSRCCASVTIRWQEFYLCNPGFKCDNDPAPQDVLWSKNFANIMNQQSGYHLQVGRSIMGNDKPIITHYRPSNDG